MSGMAQAFGIGTLIGIVLFFVLAHFGVIDRLLTSIERMFK
jgi:hypothetical protein